MSDTPPPQRASLLPAGAIVTGLLTLVCIGGVGTTGVLAAIAIPNFITMQLKAKRSEVPTTLQSVAVAELAHHAAYDRYVAAGSRVEAERAVRSSGGKDLRPWDGGEGWDALGWYPDPVGVRGAYWVEVTPDGGSFTAYGISDVDGDGVLAEYAIGPDGDVRMLSDAYAF